MAVTVQDISSQVIGDLTKPKAASPAQPDVVYWFIVVVLRFSTDNSDLLLGEVVRYSWIKWDIYNYTL